MKKILAVLLVVVIATVLCVSINAADTKTSMSLDRIYVNDAESPLFDGYNAELSNSIDDEVTALRVRGWGYFNDGSEIEQFGYRIDDGEAVIVDGAAFVDEVIIPILNQPTVLRYDFRADVTNVGKGEHTFTVVIKAKDGTIADMSPAFTFNQQLNATGAIVPSGTDPVSVPLTKDAENQVTVEEVGGKLVCTTNAGANDPWISIALDNVDTSVYKYVTITYTATKEIGSNNTYLKDTEVNKGYSGTGGTWCGHGMAGTADGAKHTKTYSIDTDFPTMVGTTLTGIRFTACGEEGGVFTIESIVFSATDPAGNPGTADAAVIAIAAVACIALAGVVVAKKVK